MKNLHLTEEDYISMREDEQREIKHLQWVIDKIHMDKNIKQIYEKDLYALVVDVKIKAMECCEI